MRRRRKLPGLLATATAACATILLLVAAGGSRGAPLTAATTLTSSFPSTTLQSRVHFLVHLPVGYATSAKRYPVIYFLHGLPADPGSYQSLSWLATALDGTGRKAILIAPQGTRQPGGDPEYHDWGPGENWETALAIELPAYIDAHFRTIRNRTGRAIVGLSAGGYGASIFGVHHPAKFAVIESWSGYFHPTDPTGEKPLDLGTAALNADASVHTLVPKLAAQIARYPTFVGFYVGAQDPIFAPENLQLARELTAAGIPHLFAVYAGAHTTSLWQQHATAWLALALAHLAPAVRA